MMEVTIKHNKSNHSRYFENPDSQSSIRCAFRDRSCSPDCAACVISTCTEGERNTGKSTSVKCIRIPFKFADIVSDETDYGPEE